MKEHAKRIHSQERKARNAAQAAVQAAMVNAPQAQAAQPPQAQNPLVINEEANTANAAGGNNNNDKFVPRVSVNTKLVFISHFLDREQSLIVFIFLRNVPILCTTTISREKF